MPKPSRFLILCAVMVLTVIPLKAQTAHLEGQIFEYTTYYLSSFDLATGTSNVQLFSYRILADSYPVYVKLYFKGSMVSNALGISDPSTIIELETSPVELKAPIKIDSRDLSGDRVVLFDMASPPNQVDIHGTILDVMNPGEFDIVLSSIITTGKLANGEYTFEIKLYSGPTRYNLGLTDTDKKEILVRSPVSITLESPGGALVDTAANLVYTNYPVFNWNSGGCGGCGNYIRVAEFKPAVHSSAEDAIIDDVSLPFNSSQEWYRIGNYTNFQYPLSGARPLEYGKIYVWQIRQSMNTTAGPEDLVSGINAFKVAEAGGVVAAGFVSPISRLLERALGGPRYQNLTGSGKVLNGYRPTEKATINNIPVDQASVKFILNQIISRNLVIQSVRVENK